MYDIDEILKMKYPYELYSNDKDIAKKEHISLLKMFHPDLHSNSDEYKEALIKVNELYQEALRWFEHGKWIEDGMIKLASSDNRNYSMKYNVDHSFELGKYYIGDNSILYLIDKVHLDFINNAIDKIENLKYADEEMKDEFERILPKILIKFNTLDEKVGILMEKTEDVYCLRDILNYYNGKMPANHVAWILSTLYNLACYLYYNGLSHNGITIDNYFISPEYHTGLLLGGWWYSTKIDEKMLGVSDDIYKIMSPNMKASKTGTYTLDLESIRLIGRTLLGDKNGMELINDSEIPKPLIDWVRGIPVTDPIEEFKLWDNVIKKSYGKRKFVEMNIDKDKLYRKNL